MEGLAATNASWNATANETFTLVNTSSPPAENISYEPDVSLEWIWSIADGVLMCVIVGGNTLTILAVTLSRRLSTLVSNQFVLNLAISDLMVGLTLPYHLTFYLDQDLGKFKWTCLMRFILITLACLASIYNLIAIAVDRYIAILHPLHYSRYMTKPVTRMLMGATWTTAITISLVPLFWNNWQDELPCDMNLVIPGYTLTILAPMFSLIWMVMLILYWRIWREAACHAKRMRTNTCCPSSSNDWKSIQVVLLVLGSFSFCWMPFVVVACTQTLPRFWYGNMTAFRSTFTLAVCNSGINPIIYAWKNAGFRAAFARLLHCRRPDCSEYRGTSPPVSERKRASGSVALQESGSLPSGGRAVRLSFKESSTDSPRCRIIENAGYVDTETDTSYSNDAVPVHRTNSSSPARVVIKNNF